MSIHYPFLMGIARVCLLTASNFVREVNQSQRRAAQFVCSQLEGPVVWVRAGMETPFRKLLDEHRPAVEREVFHLLGELNEFYRTLPEERLAASASRIVGLLLLAYDDPQSEVLYRAVLGLIAQRHEQGISLREALSVVAVPRRAICNVLRQTYPHENFHDDIERLTRTVEELSATILDGYEQRMNAAMTEQAAAEKRYRLLYDRSPIMMHSIDARGRLIEVNEEWEKVLGYSRTEVLGRPSVEFMTEESRQAAIQVNIPRMLKDGYIRDAQYQFIKKNGELVDVMISAIVVKNADDQIDRILGVLLDVTERLQYEEALRRAAASESTLAAQEEMIRALSCPLIPFGKGALLMPLIGHVNHGRASRIIEELAKGVVEQQASMAILDVTGVPDVDAEVADALLRAANVVRLLGADVMLTGIQPGIAKVIVELGIDLSGFTVKSSLREGLSQLMRNREWRQNNQR